MTKKFVGTINASVRPPVRESPIIMKVWAKKVRNGVGQKCVTVPKDCDIRVGDMVELVRLMPKERRSG